MQCIQNQCTLGEGDANSDYTSLPGINSIKPLIGVVVSLSAFLNISFHFLCSRRTAAASLFENRAKSECAEGRNRNWIMKGTSLFSELNNSEKRTLRSSLDSNLGPLIFSQMLLPTEPLELWHWSRG